MSQRTDAARLIEIAAQQVIELDPELVEHVFGTKVEHAVKSKLDPVHLARQQVIDGESLLRGGTV